MKHPEPNPRQVHARPARLAAALAALLCLGLLAASPASAAYEQVQNFSGTAGVLKSTAGTSEQNSSRWPEEVQLGGVSGMAVNYTGAGGVPKGTLYAATGYPGIRIARFTPGGAFGENWTFTGPLGGAPSMRCGPEGNPAEPVCTSRPEGQARPLDVDIDQSTGDVYVYDAEDPPPLPGAKLIHVYTPDGSRLIAEFGEASGPGETTAASPEKLHAGNSGNIAVDASGDVYVFDTNRHENFHRLMEFVPQSPGDYEDYVYAGQGHDVAAGTGENTVVPAPEMPVFDAAGHLYIANEFSGRIAKLDPGHPEAPLLCEFRYQNGGIYALTVNPEGEEVFFYSYKEPGRLHELGAGCEEGSFSEAGSFAFSPRRTEGLNGLAFDPARQYGPGRPAGVLYAGAANLLGGKHETVNGENLGESAIGYVFSRPAELPPVVESETASHVTVTTTELGARINPKSSATRYAFQYETEASYQANPPSERFAGASETPPGGAFAGEGTEGIGVSGSLAELSPDTTYRYRAVAVSHCSVEDPEKICEGSGEDAAFRTFPIEAPGLPDHRAYELVSPTQKQGGQVFPGNPRIYSCKAPDCKPGIVSVNFPKQSAPDGESIAYEGSAFDSEASALTDNEYVARRNGKTGWQTTNLTPTELLTSGAGGGFEAFGDSLATAVFEQQGIALSPEAPSGYHDLYAQPTGNPLAPVPLLREEPRDRSGGEFELAYAGASADLSRIFFAANDALTEETPVAPAAIDGGREARNLYEWHEGSLALVNVMPGNAATEPWPRLSNGGPKAVSEDGSRVFFADKTGQLYVRIDGEETKEIGTEGTPDPAEFLAAAADGSKVLLKDGHLHSTEGEEATVDLTQGKGGFQGILGQSEDLSRVYFVDTAVLSEEENQQHATAQAGQNNLYAWEEGKGTSFVATLAAKDNLAADNLGDWIASPSQRTAEASPDGRWLAFLSLAPLTGYDSTNPSCSVESIHASEPCAEAFLYDSATGTLACASCNRSGEQPLGATVLLTNVLPSPRYLTNEGRLFFDSRDSLLPADTNDGVEDVYEYEPKGAGKAGTCEREEGCVSLISTGTGVVDSNFLAMSEGGRDVFFTTRDQLTLRDRDELIDLYDAREEGGIPAETEVARGECQGEACQPLVTVPNDPTPGSSTFEGAGNVVEGQHSKKPKHARKHKHAKRHAHHGRAAKHNGRGAK